MFNIKRLSRSFSFAWRGLSSVFRKEQNFQVHVLISLLVIMLSIYFDITLWQWCLITFLIFAVLILEILNTVFERLIDVLKPRMHEYVGEVKDLMSAIVLLASVGSAIIGLIIFIPYFYN